MMYLQHEVLFWSQILEEGHSFALKIWDDNFGSALTNWVDTSAQHAFCLRTTFPLLVCHLFCVLSDPSTS